MTIINVSMDDIKYIVESKIKAVKEYAEENVLKGEILKNEIQNGQSSLENILGDATQNYVINLYLAFTACFSIEEHPIGVLRHLSIMSNVDQVPSPTVANILAEKLGFINKATDLRVVPMITTTENGDVFSIYNVYEPVNGDLKILERLEEILPNFEMEKIGNV